MTWSRYLARWRGADYTASPELRAGGLWLRLRAPGPADGFEQAAPGRWVRPVPAAECERVSFVTTVCEWGGAPFLVLADRDGELLIEYCGGLTPVAERLRLERIERGVHRRWVPRDEAMDLRENTVHLSFK
ncbi:hypothetical protein ITP53_51100 [Nonomuraea sp. K274]|uniref:Uncharacterized protein n=1 Tax=Nonomuraea cypriaca TaxID=1187855 RepID=A0A931AJ84_9ACTN|nr:hypothetical protein [Nonomuraea cypriaca]MBF8193891.1 hypothetical protein [Nonomuraea cypriaca]